MTEENLRKHPRLATLAGELLEDIELGRLPTHSLLLKTSRLARLVDAQEILCCLEFEMGGYGAEDPISREYMRLTGRWQEGNKDPAFRAPLPQLDVFIAELEAEVQNLGPTTPEPSGLQPAGPGAAHARVPPRSSDPLQQWKDRHHKLVRLQAIKGRVLTLLYQFISDTYYQEDIEVQTGTLLETLHSNLELRLEGISGAARRELSSNLKRLEESEEAQAAVQGLCRQLVDRWLWQNHLGSDSDENSPGTENGAGDPQRLAQFLRYIENQGVRDSQRIRLTRVAENLSEALSESGGEAWDRSESVLLFLQTYLFLVELDSLPKKESKDDSEDRKRRVTREEISRQLTNCGDALKAYDEILSLSPDLASSYLGKGDTLARIAALQQQLAQYKPAVECLEQACTVYDEALKRDPNYLEAYSHKADALASMSRSFRKLGQQHNSIHSCRQAQSCFDQVLLRAPELTPVIIKKGDILVFEARLLLQLNQGSDAVERYEEGISQYQKAVLLDPAESRLYPLIARTRRTLAQMYRKRGALKSAVENYHEAVGALDSAQAQMPGDAGMLSRKGDLLSEQAGLEAELSQREAALFSLRKAVTAYDELIRRSPESPEGHTGRGNALASTGELYMRLSIFKKAFDSLAAAVTSYDRAFELGEQSSELFNNRGSALLGLAELHSHFSRGREALATCQRSVRSHQEAIRRTPDWPLSHVLLGNALTGLAELLVKDGQEQNAYRAYQDALAAYDKALSLDPESARASANKGNTLVSLADLEATLHETGRAQTLYRQAVRCYEKALEKSPDSVEVHNNLGTAFSGLALLRGDGGEPQGAFQDFERAVQSYDTALEKIPDFTQARRNKGIALLSRGELEASLSLKTEAQKSLSSAINEFLLAREVDSDDESVTPLLERARAILNLIGTLSPSEA